MARIRVAIADDHTMLREGIRALLAREADLEIVAEAADGAEAQKIVEKFQPDILLLDPTLLKGPQALQTLRAKSQGTEIVILTEGPPGEEFLDYIKAGAKGAISKGDTGADLAKALRAVAGGEIWARRKVMTRVLEELSALAPRVERPQGAPVSRLTQRELKIAELVSQGSNNREIADTLRLSENTVKNHLTNIFQKLGCRNRSQLTAFLLRRFSPDV
jgi:two-component system NarL family response regulator